MALHYDLKQIYEDGFFLTQSERRGITHCMGCGKKLPSSRNPRQTYCNETPKCRTAFSRRKTTLGNWGREAKAIIEKVESFIDDRLLGKWALHLLMEIESQIVEVLDRHAPDRHPAPPPQIWEPRIVSLDDLNWGDEVFAYSDENQAEGLRVRLRGMEPLGFVDAQTDKFRILLPASTMFIQVVRVDNLDEVQ